MLALLGGVSLALAPGPAPPAVELRWDAPPGCPGQAALEQEVAALLADHEPPARATPARLHFRVERRGATWHLHGEITSSELSGHRRLSATTCEELLAAAALLTAIVVDPAGLDEPVPTPEPAPAEPALTEPVVPVVPAPEPPRPAPAKISPRRAPPRAVPPRELGAYLGAAAGLGLGALPGPAGLLRLTAGVRGRAWSFGLLTDFWLPREGVVPAAPEVGGRFWLAAAGARGCGLLHAGRVEFPLCGAVLVGAVTGRGTGALMTSRRQTALWAGVTAGPGLRVPLTRRLGLTVSADLLVILAVPRFEITDRGRACCDDRVGGQFTGGLELRLP